MFFVNCCNKFKLQNVFNQNQDTEIHWNTFVYFSSELCVCLNWELNRCRLHCGLVWQYLIKKVSS